MLRKQMICHNYCKKIAFKLSYGCLCVSLGCFYQQSKCCRKNKFMSKCFQRSPQITCRKRGIDSFCLTFVHYVFSNVPSNGPYEKISSRIGCIFLLLFTVCFQMCSQIVCTRGYIVLLIEFVWFFYFSLLCVFICLLKWPVREDAKSHWLHFLDLM